MTSSIQLVLQVDRVWFYRNRTISQVDLLYPSPWLYGSEGWYERQPGTYHPDERFSFGFLLEDCDRGLDASWPLERLLREKIAGETAIPTGEYEVGLETSGKYGPNTPTVLNVPAYKYIRYHPGNTELDTKGCQCLGLELTEDHSKVLRSKPASDWWRARVREVKARNGRVRTIISRMGPLEYLDD